MKIQANAGAAAAAPTRASAPAPGFEPMGEVGAARESAPASPMGALTAAPSLDALLALQEAPGPLERRKRAVRRAGRLLDALDQVKLSMLDGESAVSELMALKGAAADHRAETDDPPLESLLNEIETRALVELAKVEIAQAAQANAA